MKKSNVSFSAAVKALSDKDFAAWFARHKFPGKLEDYRPKPKGKTEETNP